MPSMRAAAPPMFLAVAFLSACAGQPGASLQSVASGLSSASAGLCSALTALPDASAAARAFTDFAHSELHVLAADDRLDRSLQAAVLQAMQRVEADIQQGGGAAGLYADLTTLKRWTDESLQALGEEVPTCGS